MHVKSTPPNIFATGELLDTIKLNDNAQYVADAVAEVAKRRYAHSVVRLPFYLGTTGLVNGDNQATRSYIIPAVDDMLIERIIVSGSCSAGSATLVVYNATTGTTAPSEVTNPIATVTTTVATTVYTQPIYMSAGSQYRLELTGSSFTTSKLDVVIHFRTDKLSPSGTDLTPSPSWTKLRESDSLDPAVLVANAAAFTTAVSTLTSNTRALRVAAYTFPNFSSATDADTLRMELPRAYSSDATQNLHTMVSSVSMAAAGAALQQIVCSVTNASGTSIGVSNTHSVSTLTESTTTDSTTADVSSGTSGVTSDSTADYRVTVSNSAATVCSKATVWIFFY